MKFDCIDLKIWAFKVGKKKFLWTLVCNFRWLWLPFVEKFCTTKFDFKILCVEELNWESREKNSNKNTWFPFFKKLSSRSRSKIERKTKLFVTLRWDWKTIITTMRLFNQASLTSSNKFFWKIVKIAFRNEFYKLFFQQIAQIAPKTRLSITFSLLVQIEWIKDSHVDKNIIF